MKRKIIIGVIVATVILGIIGAFLPDEEEETDSAESVQVEEEEQQGPKEEPPEEKEEEPEVTVKASGADFDVNIKEIKKNGIVLTCTNTDDKDHISCTVETVEILGKLYDPAEADDGGKLQLRDLAYPDTNAAWIDIEPSSTTEIKITCDDCKSADDYKNMSVNFDEALWDTTESSPKTWRYYALSIDVSNK